MKITTHLDHISHCETASGTIGRIDGDTEHFSQILTRTTDEVVRVPRRARTEGSTTLQKYQLLHRNVQWFRGGLVLMAHRLVDHSTLGLKAMKKRREGFP